MIFLSSSLSKVHLDFDFTLVGLSNYSVANKNFLKKNLSFLIKLNKKLNYLFINNLLSIYINNPFHSLR